MERSFSSATYLGVCAVLIVMTVLTVLISFIDLAPQGHVAAGLLIGAAKAVLVMLFFMHALRSGKVTWMVISVAAFWMLLLFTLTMTDYLTRGLVPNMPGH